MLDHFSEDSPGGIRDFANGIGASIPNRIRAMERFGTLKGLGRFRSS